MPFDILLQALIQIPIAHLWLAGDGPLRQELERLAQNLGLLDRVHFLGWRKDRSALLLAADVVVMPSRYEPTSLVVSNDILNPAGQTGHIHDT